MLHLRLEWPIGEQIVILTPKVEADQGKYPMRFDEISTPTGFTTARGSTYAIHADGTTTRTKAARADYGHVGDEGVKQRSAKTFYIEAGAAQRLAPYGVWAIIDMGDGALSLATRSPEGRWGMAPESREVPVSATPAIGLCPFELWEPETIYGFTGYRSLHLGNPITALAE